MADDTAAEIERDILDNISLRMLGIGNRIDEETQKSYVAYIIRFYCPQIQWTIEKRYNDFLHFRNELESIECFDLNFMKLLDFNFPVKHIFSSDSIVVERKVAFQRFLELALKVSAITNLVVDFIELRKHLTQPLTYTSFNDAPNPLVQDPPSPINGCAGWLGSRFLKPHRMKTELSFKTSSQILDGDMASTMCSFLPPSVQGDNFRLTYSTWNDGWNLDTMFEKVGVMSPVVILIHLVESNAVIGAYLSSPLGPPSYVFRGDGTCAVFRLDPPHAHLYNCPIDISPRPQQSKVPFSTPELDIGTIQDRSTKTEYFFANTSYIAIGGSHAFGTNAIRLSGDLLLCSCGPSDTYGNMAPLVEPLSPKIVQMKVGDIEVFCSRGVL